MENLDYRYLKAFLLTAETGSFSKAAELLSIAQSAVSRQIKLLEESLGEELIVRSSKKVLLTNKGSQLFLIAKNFDRQALDIFQKEDHRPLRIGVLQGLLESWLTPILARYYKKHNKNIEIHVSIPAPLREDMEKGFFDVIFTTENIQTELISSRHILNEGMVLISKKEVNRKKLHERRWIVYGPNDFIFQISPMKSPSIIMVDSMNTIISLVKQDIGVAVVPDHVVKDVDGLLITEIPELRQNKIFMATLNYKNIPKSIKDFYDLVLDSSDRS